MKKIYMGSYVVNVIIENKPGINDPEGDTILKDLVLKGKYTSVSKIQSAKLLKFQVKEKNKDDAIKLVHKLCDELRIYNSMVSKLTVTATDA